MLRSLILFLGMASILYAGTDTTGCNLAGGGNIVVPAGVYDVGDIDLLPDTHITTTGGLVVFNIPAGCTYSLKTANRISVEGPKFTGTGTAIKSFQSERWRVRECCFCTTNGIDITGKSPWPDIDQKYAISRCELVNCTTGINCGPLAEYGYISEIKASGCTTAVRIEAGNVMLRFSDLSDNVTAILLVAGTNHAHCRIDGVLANHCTYALDAANVTFGETIQMTVFGGPLVGGVQTKGTIRLVNCRNFQFHHSQFGGPLEINSNFPTLIRDSELRSVAPSAKVDLIGEFAF